MKTSIQIEQCVRKLFADYNLNSKANIGNYSELYAEHNPQTEHEFMLMVNQYAPRPLKAILHQLYTVSIQAETGLTIDELKQGMKQFLITDSFNGLNKERKAVAELQALFPDLNFFQDSKLDTDYGVDIAIDAQVEGKSVMVLGIQVKPTSYFTSNPTAAHATNIQIDQRKNQQFEAQYKAGVFYLNYSKNIDGFTNKEHLVQRIENAYRLTVLKQQLVTTDFLVDDTLDAVGLDMMIRLLTRKKKQLV